MVLNKNLIHVCKDQRFSVSNNRYKVCLIFHFNKKVSICFYIVDLKILTYRLTKPFNIKKKTNYLCCKKILSNQRHSLVRVDQSCDYRKYCIYSTQYTFVHNVFHTTHENTLLKKRLIHYICIFKACCKKAK